MQYTPAIVLLEKLPEPVRTEAIKEAWRQKTCTIDWPVSKLDVAIATAFIWSDTKQGPYYWRDVARKYANLV